MNNKEFLSKEELERYLRSEMNSKEMNATEMKAQEDSFNDSAFEGFVSNPEAISDLDELKNKFYSKSNNSGRSTFRLSGIIISAAATIAVIFISYYYINLLSNENQPSISQNIKEQIIEDIAPNINITKDLEADNSIHEKNTLSDTLSETPSISKTPQKSHKKESVTTKEKTIEKKSENADSEVVYDMTMEDETKYSGVSLSDDQVKFSNDVDVVEVTAKAIQQSNIEMSVPVAINNSATYYSPASPSYTSPATVSGKDIVYTLPIAEVNINTGVMITYLYDLKIIDYTQIYEQEIKKDKNAVISGLDARYENKKNLNSTAASDDVIEYITYADFLEDCIMYYKSGRYELAIDNFKIILREHPEELNAWFYSGLSYFEIGDYVKALENLDFVIRHPVNEFNQEAEWYKVLTLIKLNSRDNAKDLLYKIISDSLFYYNQAIEKLKELDN